MKSGKGRVERIQFSIIHMFYADLEIGQGLRSDLEIRRSKSY